MKSNLPLYAFAHSELAGKTMMLIRGERGFHDWDTDDSPEELNRLFGVTPEQAKAMWVGAMYGWDSPGADPDYHTVKHPEVRIGKLVHS